MTVPILQIKNVKKYFPIYRGVFRHVEGYVKAVDGVDLTIKKGEVHALVGESGSGKSTLGRVAIQLIPQTEGEILFKGEDTQKLITSDFKKYRKSCQMIFQDPLSSLNPRHTIEKTIGDGLLYHGLVKTEAEKKERIAWILNEVGLTADAMYRYPHQFSGGQQQRLCIGRAVCLEPELIVCDEAVSALDVSVQAQILNLLSKLQKEFNLSYLFISHDLSVVRHFSDHITVMYLGKVMESGPSASIFNNPQNHYTKMLLASTPIKSPDERKS